MVETPNHTVPNSTQFLPLPPSSSSNIAYLVKHIISAVSLLMEQYQVSF